MQLAVNETERLQLHLEGLSVIGSQWSTGGVDRVEHGFHIGDYALDRRLQFLHRTLENCRSRRLFDTTNNDDNPIAAAAIAGLRMPNAASGIAAAL